MPWALLAGLGGLWAGSVAFQLGPMWSGNPDYQYGWFVPLLCGLLFWERWKVRPSGAPARLGVAGGVALSIGVVVLSVSAVFLQVSPNWRFMGWWHAGALVGLTLGILALWGGWTCARHLAFPVLFFLVAVPWHSRIERPLIDQLSLLNAVSSAGLAGLLGTPCVRQGLVIETGGGMVGVEDACSGIRSIQSTIMVALFLGELFNHGFFRRILLLGSGLTLAVVANIARTTFLVRTCDLHGPEGMHRWHDSAGFTILAVTLAGLMLLVWWLTPQARPAGTSAGGQPAPPRAVAVGAGARVAGWVLCGVCLAVGMTQVALEFWFRLPETARLSVPPWTFQLPVPAATLHEGVIPETTRALLKYDEGRLLEWQDVAGHRFQAYYLRWAPARDRYRAAESSGQARGHAPSLCLRNAGMTLQTNLGTAVLESGGVRVQHTVERYLDRGRSLHVLAAYWEPDWHVETAGPKVGPSTGQALRDAVKALRRRSRGREEKRVLKIGVWDMEEDAAGRAALESTLRACIREAR